MVSGKARKRRHIGTYGKFAQRGMKPILPKILLDVMLICPKLTELKHGLRVKPAMTCRHSINTIPAYSVRSASMGGIFAALLAGFMPKINPTAMENTTASNAISGDIA